MSDLGSELEQAWSWRHDLGLFDELGALRVFHGPGEGSHGLQDISIDRFGPHYWVTLWGAPKNLEEIMAGVCQFLKEHGAQSAVVLSRPEKGAAEEPKVLFGVAEERFIAHEMNAKYWIQFKGAKHPGLFLDHAPLRHWLRARAKGWRVLNSFAYTGSLSVAAGLGGAGHVTTLDLSKPAIQWASANWKLNGLLEASGRFIAGDVFEWLPRLKRGKESFDCVILDPPSFARGEKGSFSTAKDLKRLHVLAMDVLAPGGFLVTSINSANVSWAKYEADVLAAAREKKQGFEIISRIDLPETFPTRLGDGSKRYLKGWILKRC